MNKSNVYDENSIISLNPREHVRLRPGVYAGDTSNPNQLLLEIFSNSLDEHNIGHGDIIDISINEDNSITLKDRGQGFLINKMREDGCTVLEASYSVMNTSGKYSDDGVYEGVSLGTNGMGSKLTNFLSEWFEVISWQKGKYEHLWFKEGILEKREVGEWTDENCKSGTTITFLPDKQFFDSIKVDEKFFNDFFNDVCCLCPNLTIVYTSSLGTNVKISHPAGIVDLIKRRIGDSVEIIDNKLIISNEVDGSKLDLALSFTTNSSSTIVPYVNFGLTDTGPHITGIKSTITRVINNWAKENNLLKKNDKNLDGSSIQEGMVLVCNIITTNVAYNAQVKTTVSKIDSAFVNTILAQQLELWLDQNPADAKNIIEKALLSRKAAEAAKKAREKVKAGKENKNKNKILNPDKLKDAEYLGENSTLLVVEGLSAGASMAVARDITKYGILMLKGKLINAFNNTKEKLEKNEEIQLLIKALGFSFGEKYDSSKLRYGKIGICVDSDSDGGHISLLIATAIQHFYPEFIEEGRLCWLRSPLYIVKNKNGTEDYYFTDKEKDEATMNGLINGEIQRNKGLGSLSELQARNSMFNEENQRLDVLFPTEEAINLLNTLMGGEVKERKEYIFNNVDFSEVME